MKKVKILCTIGPSSVSKQIMKRMTAAGMDAIRVNISHGKLPDYKKTISNAKSIADFPIILDTEGPDIRIKCKQEVQVKKNTRIVVGFTDDEQFSFTVNFYKDIAIGAHVWINDGLLEGVVEKKQRNRLVLKMKHEGLLQNGKGVTIPSVPLPLSILTSKDIHAIKGIPKHIIDFIAVSFVRNKKDLQIVRKYAGKNVKLIAKIENHAALDNFDEILEEADAIMVARGDLGVQLPSESIPLTQKAIIQRCNQIGKPVIVATQMLESMITNPIPTRAETSDVANAILDGADTIMLSAETAVGKYPIEAVQAISNIAMHVENQVQNKVDLQLCTSISDVITKGMYDAAQRLPPQKYQKLGKLIAITRTGYTANILSRFRINKEIIAVTDSPQVKRQLMISFGVTPVCFSSLSGKNEVSRAIAYLYKNKFVSKNELVVITAAKQSKQGSISNFLQIAYIYELLKNN